MNIEPLLTHSAGLMYRAAKRHGGKLHLCYWKGKLECLPVKHTIHRHFILFIFEALEMTKGLEIRQWDQIRKEMSKLTKELELCLTDLKKSNQTAHSQSKT